MTAYTGIPEVTGRIEAYRRGDIPFTTLLSELAQRDYAKPSHWNARGGDVREIAEGADHFEPGTIGEIVRAGATGLLTRIEQEAILSAILRSHGA